MESPDAIRWRINCDRCLPAAIGGEGERGQAQRQPLIDSAWLKVRLGHAGVVIVDLGSAAGLTRSGFRHGHRRGSVYSDYRGDGWRVFNAEGAPVCWRRLSGSGS